MNAKPPISKHVDIFFINLKNMLIYFYKFEERKKMFIISSSTRIESEAANGILIKMRTIAMAAP